MIISTHNQISKSADIEDEELGKQAVRLANAAVLPMVLKSVIELNIIDIISTDGGALSAEEIAAKLPTKNPDAGIMIDRMLRLLVSYDVLTCSLDSNGENGEVVRRYGAAPICRFLTKAQDIDGCGSVAPLFCMHHDKVSMDSWYHLSEAILEGGVPFCKSKGMKLFDYIGTDQRFNTVFNFAMSNHTTLIMKKVLQVYTGFENVEVLVDVGGGTGETLDIIISKYNHIKGINYELPHVLAQAPTFPGVEHVAGDMFASVPKGDAIFLKWMLHAWTDESSVKLLKNCYDALPSSGKVIIVESIMPEIPENHISSHIVCEQDMLGLAQTMGGRERTLKQYETLAIQAGFSGCKAICSAYNSWVMEMHKTTDN